MKYLENSRSKKEKYNKILKYLNKLMMYTKKIYLKFNFIN